MSKKVKQAKKTGVLTPEKTIWIGPYAIPIYRVGQELLQRLGNDPEDGDEKLYGYYSGSHDPAAPKAIFILDNLEATAYYDTLIHEILHATASIFGLTDYMKDEELVCSILATALVQALNP